MKICHFIPNSYFPGMGRYQCFCCTTQVYMSVNEIEMSNQQPKNKGSLVYYEQSHKNRSFEKLKPINICQWDCLKLFQINFLLISKSINCRSSRANMSDTKVEFFKSKMESLIIPTVYIRPADVGASNVGKTQYGKSLFIGKILRRPRPKIQTSIRLPRQQMPPIIRLPFIRCFDVCKTQGDGRASGK